MRDIQIQIERVEIKAKPRKLGRYHRTRRRGKKLCWFQPLNWTCEIVRDIECHHSFDVEEEITKVLMADILGSRND